jgi:beta-lactamase regulating signal transducer with metallopeptidase domain
MIAFLEVHLLESTAFAIVACLLAFCLRKRSATARHTVWLIAAVKFAVPAALFSACGAYVHGLLPSPRPLVAISASLSRLLPAQSAPSPAAEVFAGFWILLGFLWFSGTLVMLAVWFKRLPTSIEVSSRVLDSEIESLSRMQQRLGYRRAVRLQSSQSRREPVLSGIWRPTITLPHGLSAKLTPAELDAVMLHELAHAKRWDNLTGVFVHGLVCLFWFHPLLWCIERQLIAEREFACDEMVVRYGAPPEDYVAGILKVCRFHLAGASTEVSGVTGSNLKKRMEEIMSYSLRKPVPHAPKLLLGVVIASMTLIPMTAGFLKLSSVYGQAKPADKPSSGQVNERAPVSCTNASKAYPEGTVIQDGDGPEQMCVAVLAPNPNDPDRLAYAASWVRTSETTRERSRNVLHFPATPIFSCKPKPSSSTKLCSCEGAEKDGFSQGAIVDSANGKLRCDKGRWRLATRRELGYTN